MCDTPKPACGICTKTVEGIALTCKYCFRSYHTTCKKIIGANIKKYVNNYLCSDVCQANYDRIMSQRSDDSDDSGADNDTVQQLKSYMNLKFNALQLSIDTALSENKELTKKVDVLSKKCVSLEKTVENLKHEADGVQRLAVRNNITILGVPSSMDPKVAFTKLCAVVGHAVVENDVQNIKSFKNKVTKATTIVVEFSRYQAKRDFLAKKKVKGNVTAAELTGVAATGNRPKLIFIRDELTRRGMALYAELRDLRKLVKIKYCWTRDGDVFARIDDNSKFICVKSSFDIQDLANTAEPIDTDA
jgi:hypothetical protein